MTTPKRNETVNVDAVAVVQLDRMEGLWLDWLTEGGIAELEEGCVLYVTDVAITDDEGAGQVYPASVVDALQGEVSRLREVAGAFLDAADARDNEETSTQYPEHERRLREYKAARKDLMNNLEPPTDGR